MPDRYELQNGRMVLVSDAQPAAQPTASAQPQSSFMDKLVATPGRGESLGGLVGGIPGLVPALKPVSVPLAGVGGAMGSLADQLLSGGAPSFSEAGAAGLRQAGLEAGGGLLLKGLARPIMGILGMPGAKRAAVEGALRFRAVGPKGAQRAAARTTNDVNRLANTLPPFPRQTVTGSLRDVTRREMQRSATPRATARNMLSEVRQMERELPARIPARRALEIKRGAGRGYEQTRAAGQAGRPVAQNKRLQEGVRSSLQRGFEARSPQYAPKAKAAGDAAALNRWYQKDAMGPAYRRSAIDLGTYGQLLPGQQLSERLLAQMLNMAGQGLPTGFRAYSAVQGP